MVYTWPKIYYKEKIVKQVLLKLVIMKLAWITVDRFKEQ